MSAAVVVGLAACQPADIFQDPQQQGRGSISGLTVNNGLGEVAIGYTIRPVDGMTVACASFFSEGQVDQQFLRRVLVDYDVSAGDTLIIEGLAFANRVGSEDALQTGPVNCRPTSVPWQDAFASAEITGEINRSTSTYTN